MDAKLKELWLKALRSGEYLQTTNNLFDGAGYCCLGVLCDVMLRHRLVPSGVRIIKGDSFIAAHGSPYDIPNRLRQRLALPPSLHTQAIRMNDGLEDFEGRRQSFSEIADWLETALSPENKD